MQTLSEIRALLAERGLRPKHRLGQNFLHDQNQLRRLLAAASIRPGDLVLEVGPGTGTLTESLLAAGANVIACELDEGMAAIIADRVVSRYPDRASLIRGDVLQRHRELNSELVAAIGGRRFKLVANLPYQVASALITTLLIDHSECEGQFVTIQDEVADRLLAGPSSEAYGPLSVIAQAFGEVQRFATLAPSCFWPEPEVTSAMVAITPKPDARERFHGTGREFARFVTDVFSKRRKQLGTIVGRSHAAWPGLRAMAIAPEMRPEELSSEQMIALWRAVSPIA